MILTILAAVTVTFTPPAPTVGDPITITFAQPVKLDPSPAYEVVTGVVRASGAPREARQSRAPLQHQVVVRTFAPRPFTLSGTTGGVRFRNLTVPVRSVLKQNDDLVPAPLTPPHAIPYPRAPFIAIAIAALFAIATWALAWVLARRAMRVVLEPAITADERFRRAVAEARAHEDRWAALADATRAYLAETRANLGSELTTTELLPRLDEREHVVVDILRHGDMEKFSPVGAPLRDFDEVASKALELAS